MSAPRPPQPHPYRTRHGVAGEMLHHKILRVEDSLPGGRINGQHRVLLPAPGAAPFGGKRHIPVNIGVDSVHEVMLVQAKNIFGVKPGILPITAFIFRLHVTQLRVALHGTLDRMLTRPLIANTLNVFIGFRITKHHPGKSIMIAGLLLQPFIPRLRGVDGAEPDFRIQPMLLERRSEIIADENLQLLPGPDTGRELLVGDHFILHMHLMYGNALCPVGLYELHEIEGISSQNLRLPAERAVIIRLRKFHPRRRTPGRSE
ncbi:hypothetical protein D3C73_521400 [compost metagenome]